MIHRGVARLRPAGPQEEEHSLTPLSDARHALTMAEEAQAVVRTCVEDLCWVVSGLGISQAGPEALARRFHETYERLAPDFGQIREAPVVPWEQVPQVNRDLMVAVCAELLSHHPTISST